MVTMNIGALRDAEGGAARRDGLAGMKATIADLASNPAMFGTVPNADQASAALRSAASAMIDELVRAGRTLDDIRTSAAAAAEVGMETDHLANLALRHAKGGG